MKEHTDNQTLAKQYLLGTLSDVEVDRLEERYFSDNYLFEEIGIAEDELIDAYVRERLSSPEREQFEKVLSRSPRLSERVHYGRLLRERASTRLAELPDHLLARHGGLSSSHPSSVRAQRLGPQLFLWRF